MDGIELEHGRLRIEEERPNHFLPYTDDQTARPLVILSSGHQREQLVAVARLEQFQEVLNAVSDGFDAKFVGGEPHYHYREVTMEEATRIYEAIAAQTTNPDMVDNSEKVLDSHRSLIETSECPICAEPFSMNDDVYTEVVTFGGAMPAHTRCCSDLAERLDVFWDDAGTVISDLL